jgi:hypothetical protein
MSVTAFANDYNQDDPSGNTTLNFNYKPDPIYTVTIPANLNLDVGDNPLTLTVSDSDFLNGKTIQVTCVETQHEDNELVLECNDAAEGFKTLPYGLYNTKGNLVGISAILAEFNGDGPENININIGEGALANIEPFKLYTGTITFGIALVTPTP